MRIAGFINTRGLDAADVAARGRLRYTIFLLHTGKSGRIEREFRNTFWLTKVGMRGRELIKGPPKENEGGRPMQLRHIRRERLTGTTQPTREGKQTWPA